MDLTHEQFSVWSGPLFSSAAESVWHILMIGRQSARAHTRLFSAGAQSPWRRMSRLSKYEIWHCAVCVIRISSFIWSGHRTPIDIVNIIIFYIIWMGARKKAPSVCVRDALWILMPSQKCPWGVKEENIYTSTTLWRRVKAIPHSEWVHASAFPPFGVKTRLGPVNEKPPV